MHNLYFHTLYDTGFLVDDPFADTTSLQIKDPDDVGIVVGTVGANIT
jgi:hypothetical protein